LSRGRGRKRSILELNLFFFWPGRPAPPPWVKRGGGFPMFRSPIVFPTEAFFIGPGGASYIITGPAGRPWRPVGRPPFAKSIIVLFPLFSAFRLSREMCFFSGVGN